MHLKWLRLPVAAVMLLAQSAGARNIFITPGDSSGSAVGTYTAEPIAFGTTISPLAGAGIVLPSSNAMKFYVAGRSAVDSLTILEGRFPNLTAGDRISVGASQGITAAAITGDRQRLIVAGPSGVGIVNAATDQTVRAMGSINAGTNPIDVATSLDSTRAYVLSGDSSTLTAINLSDNTAAGSLQMTSRPNAVRVAPTGVVYVSAEATIYEIDGRAMTIRSTIPVTGTPGPLHFTLDGRYAVAARAAAFGAGGASVIDLQERTAVAPAGVAFTFTDVAVVANRLAYAINEQGELYTLSIGNDGTVSAAPAAFTGPNPGAITQIEATAELPQARYLILSTGSYLHSLDLRSNEMSERVSISNPGNLSVVPAGVRGTAADVIAYNTTQTAAPGTVTLPLVVRAYNRRGDPVAGVPVAFSTSASGVSIATPQTQTGYEGYAATTVTVPASQTSGSFTVSASVEDGSRTLQYTVNIGDPGLPGGGGQARPTGLQIHRGHGQVVPENYVANEPLAVRLTNPQGNPVQDAVITWELVSGSGNVRGETVTSGPQTSRTNFQGIATAGFTASDIAPGLSYLTNVIRVTGPDGQQVQFYITSLGSTPSGPDQPSVLLIQPAQGSTITVRAGEVLTGAIQAYISGTISAGPIPFVGMRIEDPNTAADPSLTPAAECRGGVALSDQQGRVVCDLVAGSSIGTHPLDIIVAETQRLRINLTIEPGAASSVRAVSGTPQSLNPGQTLQQLVVRVTDASGAGLANVPVTWEFPDAITVTNQTNTTNTTGQATARGRVAANATPGQLTVRARVGTAAANFTISVVAAGGSLTVVSGEAQSAAVNQQFAQPVVVQVSGDQGPVQGASVVFSVVSGNATVSPQSAQTDNQGRASATVTAGNSTGAVVVRATSGAASATFNLTVREPGPSFSAADFVNAAGYQPGISPGTIAVIWARGIAPDLDGSVTPSTAGPLPTSLAGVEVLFNSRAAPIYAVSNVNGAESVIVQVPFEVTAGEASVTIRAEGGESTVEGVEILPVKPGVFTWTDPNGQIYAVATRPDGSYVSSANPARRGEQVRIYATGLGQTMPAGGTNQVGLANQQVAAPVIAGINNAGVRVVSANALEGTVGVYVVTFEIPADTTAGNNQPVGLAVAGPDGELVFANGAWIPII